MNISYRRAFIVLLALQILYFSQVLFKGEVIYPHNNDYELAAQVQDDDRISNRKFSDHSSQFIPTINQHLNGQPRAWLTTWIPHVQFGRPDYQRWQSKVNLITHALSFLTNNPFVLYTSLTVLIVCLTGTFCFLFLKSLDLHPLACLAISAGFSMGPYLSYWLTFVQFISVRCWTLGLLWLITEFTKKRSVAAWAGIAFFTYCLLIMGRLQTVVRSAYLIVGFAAIYLWLSKHSKKTKLTILLLLAGAALLGAITSAPTYLDLTIHASRSARVENVQDQFFLDGLPNTGNIRGLGRFLYQFFDPFWFGNPIEPDYPFTFDGLSFTPLYFILFLLSFVDGQWRRLWPWQLFVALCLLATLWPPAYLFMVHYMGFHISQSKPIGAAVIPALVLAGYALDHILRNGIKQRLLSSTLIILVLLVAGLAGVDQHRELHWEFVLIGLLMVLGTVMFVRTKSQALLLALVIGSVLAYGSSIMLTRPLDQIQVTSPLVERIKLETSDGSRYAWVGSPKRVLPPNQEALLGIRSIHSYDSISSVNYQNMALQLSERGAAIYGRNFNFIKTDAKLDQPPFSYAGVSLILSRQELDNPLFHKIDTFEEIKVYKTLNSPILQTQITHFDHGENDQVTLVGYLYEQTRLDVSKLASMDDFIRFKVTPVEQETLLFVSQQYHPQWQANSQGQPIPTVMINDFYLGVIIPPHTTEIEIEFKPFVHLAWIPQIVYVVLGLGSLFGLVKDRINRGRDRRSYGNVNGTRV